MTDDTEPLTVDPSPNLALDARQFGVHPPSTGPCHGPKHAALRTYPNSTTLACPCCDATFPAPPLGHDEIPFHRVPPHKVSQSLITVNLTGGTVNQLYDILLMLYERLVVLEGQISTLRQDRIT